MSIVVPYELFDTATEMQALIAQCEALKRERENLASEYLLEVADTFAAGDLDRTISALTAFKALYGRGYAKKAEDAGLPTLQQLERTVLGACNDGDNRWTGPSPLTPTTKRPLAGTWVVYQLLDADGSLLYIGSTGDFAGRVKAHARNKSFSSWRAAACKSERDCRDLETALIDRYRPPLNRMIPTPKVALT